MLPNFLHIIIHTVALYLFYFFKVNTNDPFFISLSSNLGLLLNTLVKVLLVFLIKKQLVEKISPLLF